MTARKRRQRASVRVPRWVKLPALPESFHTQLGDVPVTIVERIAPRPGEKVDEDESVMGVWRPEVREVEIKSGMHGATMWQTLWHERVHCALFDAGVKLTHDQEESVSDAIASHIVCDMIDVLSASARARGG